MFKKLIVFIIFLAALAWGFNRLGQPPAGITQNIKWGISFSRIFAVQMNLDWRETYSAILDELQPKSLRLPIYWEDIEPQEGQYTFGDYDWMIEQAKEKKVDMILVVGRKLPRWPECHVPTWARGRSEEVQQDKVLLLISEIVKRYKNSENLFAWQVENEPFLAFGECPTADAGFLDREIVLIKSLDNRHPIMVTDSGELSIWLRAAKRADIFGTTMYRVVYQKYLGYVEYPLPPKFFWLKANIIRLFYPDKPIIVSELQAEPWGPKLLFELPLDEQEKSMNINQFRENIVYAKEVGFSPAYLWGAEWWYWMKTINNDNSYWQEAKKLLNP
jgi:hypothetical protein